MWHNIHEEQLIIILHMHQNYKNFRLLLNMPNFLLFLETLFWNAMWAVYRCCTVTDAEEAEVLVKSEAEVRVFFCKTAEVLLMHWVVIVVITHY